MARPSPVPPRSRAVVKNGSKARVAFAGEKCGPSSAAIISAIPCRLLTATVPTYRLVTRASQYAVMFLALAFLTYALFKLVARVRMHIVQCKLLSLSIILFPLLLLAFGELLGFAAAYTVAVTRRRELAGLFAGLLGGLFGFLYVVLSLEAYAALAGATVL